METRGVPLPSPPRFAPSERLVLACIQIATDVNFDTEGPALLARVPGVNVRMAKIAFDSEDICAETYEEAFANGKVRAAADSLRLPEGYVTIWGIACTSFSFLIGRDRLLTQFPPGARLVTMWDGICSALRALGAKSIAMITPYIARVHESNVALMQERGFVVAQSMHLDLSRDLQVSGLDPAYLRGCIAALAAAGPADALFVGCSAFRVCLPGLLPELEAELGMPVVTSTQAFLWHALRSGGVNDRIEGYGRLFKEH
mmetsp:Transcript_103883/g.325049  ORF Transcript_103883/g.325049 Transcript_103883/m.325049 type:complete len:258 (-) Transcript_103883:55-828(-)